MAKTTFGDLLGARCEGVRNPERVRQYMGSVIKSISFKQDEQQIIIHLEGKNLLLKAPRWTRVEGKLDDHAGALLLDLGFRFAPRVLTIETTAGTLRFIVDIKLSKQPTKRKQP